MSADIWTNISTQPQIESDDLVDFDEPEPIEIHRVYHDPEDAWAWGVMPGAGLCGFVFTTENHVGSGDSVRNDSRFMVEECTTCVDIGVQHQLEWLRDLLNE